MEIVKDVPQKETWIDEDGNDVKIYPFYSRVFIDPEVARVDGIFRVSGWNGQPRPSSFGKAQMEHMAAHILGLFKSTRLNPPSLVGVLRMELEAVSRRQFEDRFIDTLVGEGYLREKKVMGNVVIFPTEKLVKNQTGQGEE